MPSWLRTRARLFGKAGRAGGVAGRVRCRAWWGAWPGGVGRVGTRSRAGSGGGPGWEAGQLVRGGWIIGVKNVLE